MTGHPTSFFITSYILETLTKECEDQTNYGQSSGQSNPDDGEVVLVVLQDVTVLGNRLCIADAEREVGGEVVEREVELIS